MTVKEAAQYLGKSESTIRRWIKQGRLDAVLVGGRYDIDESKIDRHTEPRDQAEDITDIEELAGHEASPSQRATEAESISQLEPESVSDDENANDSGSLEPGSMDFGTYTRRYRDGELIFNEESTGKDIYFVVSGTVELSRNIGDSKMTVSTLENGDFFGEIASLTGYNRSMTATAKGAVYLWKMSSVELVRYMHMNPRFTVDICTKMAQRMGYTNLLLKHFATRAISDGSDGVNDQTETLKYLWQELKEKSAQLQDRDRQLRQLDSQTEAEELPSSGGMGRILSRILRR